MLHIVKTIKHWKTQIYAMFLPIPLEVVIAEELEEAMREKMQAEYVIKTHKFIQHMARAKIEALNKWTELNSTDWRIT